MLSTILGKVSGLSFLSTRAAELSTVSDSSVSTIVAVVAEVKPLITQEAVSTVTNAVGVFGRVCSSGCMCATTGVEPAPATAVPSALTLATVMDVSGALAVPLGTAATAAAPELTLATVTDVSGALAVPLSTVVPN